MNTTGIEKASFQVNSTDLPYFPSTVPVRKRVTYWRRQKVVGNAVKKDTVIASMEGMALALLDICDLRSRDNPEYCFETIAILRGPGHEAQAYLKMCRYSTDSVPLELQEDEFTQKVIAYFAETAGEVWTSRIAGGARPLLLEDYKTLARMTGHIYRGVLVDEENMIEGTIPLTMFHSTSVFVPIVSEGKTDNIPPKQLPSSYYTLHMEHRRRQPSYDCV